MPTATLLGPAPPARVTETMRADPEIEWYGVDLARATGLSSGRLYSTLIGLQQSGQVASSWSEHGRRRYTLTGRENRAAHTAASSEPQEWLAVAAIAAFACSVALAHRPSDLAVYVGAVSGLRHGSSLYDFTAADGAPFTYPPFAGLIFWPLTFVPTSLLAAAWTVATLATVVALSLLIARHTGVSAAILAAVLLLSAPVASDLKYGQVSIYLAGLVLVDVTLASASRWQGVLTGVAAAIKLTPLVFVPMFWLAGRRRAALIATIAFGGCAALAFGLVPADSRRFWGADMWHVSRLGAITSAGNQSFDGVLLRLGMPDPARSSVMLIVGAGVAFVALRRAGLLARSGDWLSAAIVAGAASVVASPVSWTHHQLWLLLAALLPIRARTGRPRRAWAIGILIVMILPVTTVGAFVPWPLGLVLRNARMLTAFVIACLVPLQVRPPGAGTAGLTVVPGRFG